MSDCLDMKPPMNPGAHIRPEPQDWVTNLPITHSANWSFTQASSPARQGELAVKVLNLSLDERPASVAILRTKSPEQRNVAQRNYSLERDGILAVLQREVGTAAKVLRARRGSERERKNDEG